MFAKRDVNHPTHEHLARLEVLTRIRSANDKSFSVDFVSLFRVHLGRTAKAIFEMGTRGTPMPKIVAVEMQSHIVHKILHVAVVDRDAFPSHSFFSLVQRSIEYEYPCGIDLSPISLESILPPFVRKNNLLSYYYINNSSIRITTCKIGETGEKHDSNSPSLS